VADYWYGVQSKCITVTNVKNIQLSGLLSHCEMCEIIAAVLPAPFSC